MNDRPLASTITIPCYTQPNFLHVALHALIANSYYRHRIIVLWSDPKQVNFESRGLVDDWEWQGDEITQPYKSVREFLSMHGTWLSDNAIEVVDVTEEEIPFCERYARGEVFAGKTRPQGGVDIAFKNNVGLRMTKTEWTIPNWDCDFYPDKHWDKPIFDYALGGKHEREYLIPMHAQPHVMTAEASASWDTWRDSPAISCHRLAMPTLARRKFNKEGGEYTIYTVTEPEFFAFCDKARRPGAQIREKCGARSRLHWVPWIVPTAPVVESGGFSYQGSGYDIEFDDRLGRLGFTKVGFCDAFILHKGFPPLERGRCPLREA